MSVALQRLPAELQYAVLAIVIVLLASFVLGFGNLFQLLASAVSVAVSLVVLWLFWRLVLATERIAGAVEGLERADGSETGAGEGE